MPTATRVNPFSASRFFVEIDGITAAEFLTVSGIEADVAVIDYRAGSDKLAGAHKLPGEARFSNLILRRGMTTDLSLWLWMRETLEGKVSRRNLSVVLLSDAGDELLRFNFVAAWPVRWSGPTLHAEGTDIAIETLEITHEGLSVAA